MHGLLPRPDGLLPRIQRVAAGIVIGASFQLRLRLLQQALRGGQGFRRTLGGAYGLRRVDGLAGVAHLLHGRCRTGRQQQNRCGQ